MKDFSPLSDLTDLMKRVSMLRFSRQNSTYDSFSQATFVF